MPGSYLEKLIVTEALRRPVIRSAIKKLNLPQGSKGLDAACGAGLQCLLLAEEIGTEGHVTGLDISSEFLEYGSNTIRDAGLSKQIEFKQGSVASIPFENNTFDWAWSCDFAGYASFEPIPLLKELKRVIKPGGTLAIAAWSSEQLLPGYPILEAKLRTTIPGIAPFSSKMDSSHHFLRALGWFRELGFEEPKADVFSGSVHAPLNEDIYDAMVELFDMRWPGVEQELIEEDLDQYKQLCKPDSPDFVLKNPDYYAFFTYSMFWGIVS